MLTLVWLVGAIVGFGWFGWFFDVLVGGFGVDLACFVALWCIGRRCFWCMASILARYLLSKKIKNLHADRCLFLVFWQKTA